MKKSVLYILTALLSLLCVQTSMAQAVQDALYIFRNDGQFDAFFYGDIDHIEYSKIDTLGVEQEDYVVQEIYALDTLYRIPISAIDSVAFVTPETKYKADVFLPDKSIADYIVASDSINWIRLATNTPSELIPKKGDKIFIKDASQHIPNGFVGLVTDVSNGSDGYTVMTGELEITDIFERLVAKAAAATDGRNATRGLVDGTEMSYTTEEPLDIIDESETLPLQGSYTIGKFGPIQLSGDVSGSIGYKFKEKMAIRAFLYVDAPTQKMQFTQKTIIYDDLEVEAQIAGSLTSSVDIPVKGFSKKISDFFGLKADVGVTIGAQFTAMEFGYKRQFSGEETSNIIYSNMNESSGLEPSLKKHFELTRDTTECNVSVDGKLTFNVGAFAELNLGVAYPFKKKVPSPEEKSVGVEVKLRGEIGGKMEYDSPLLGLSSTTALDPMTTIDMYGMLNSLGRVSVAGYGKIALSGEIGRWKGSTEPGFDFLKTQVRSIVPNFTGISAKQDPEKPLRPYRIRMNSTADRDLILARYIGFAVYDENDVLVADSLCDFYFKEEWYKKRNNEGTSGCVFELDPGKDEEKTYYVYPMVEYRQHHLLDKDHKHGFTLDAARIEIAERTVYVGDEQGYEEIEVVPNMANMVVKTEGGWLEEPSWLAHLNELTIYWPELPSGTKERRGVVRLYGLTKDGKDTLTVDSIVVIQSIPYIELTPDRLDFEAKGGTQTVTIGNTNITDIQISTTEFTEDYLSATLDGKVITVTMGENTDSEERGARVWVEGKTQNGEAYKTYVTISQAGTGETPEPQPVPGGDSPFKYISFMAQVMTESVTEDVDTIANAYYTFKFEDSNGNMTLTEYKDYNHYDCQGYMEDAVTGERAATLSFDITKKDYLVKNLRFATDATTKQDMIFPGIGTIHMTFHNVASMSFNDIPLTTNGQSYKESKVSVAEGLKFTSFSSETDADATYDVNSLFDPHQTGIAPVNQHTTSTYVDDAGNYIWLMIEYKEAESSDITLEWPSDAVMSGLKSGGMPVYEGSTPPTVNGTYVMSNLTVIADPVNAKGELDGTEEMVIKLSDQNNGEITFNTYFVAGGESSEADDEMKGLIIGNADEFSICVPDGEGMAFVLSGRMENGTVTDLHLASTSMDEAGQYIILKDGDGSSPTTQWSPATSSD